VVVVADTAENKKRERERERETVKGAMLVS